MGGNRGARWDVADFHGVTAWQRLRALGAVLVAAVVWASAAFAYDTDARRIWWYGQGYPSLSAATAASWAARQCTMWAPGHGTWVGSEDVSGASNMMCCSNPAWNGGSSCFTVSISFVCDSGTYTVGQPPRCVNATPPPCAAGDSSSASRYTGTFNAGNGTDSGTATPTPGTLCDGQCVMTPGAVTSCSSGAAIGSPVQCYYSGTKTGSTCSGGNGAAPTYDPCAAQGGVAGTLNGQPVCNGSGTGNNTKPGTTTSTKTTTTPTSTTTTTTSTTCAGDGSCTTTTTNQYTSGGSGANGTGPGSTTVPGTGPGTAEEGVGEKKEEDSPGAFCEENPQSPLCIQGFWSGSCGAPPACQGDAVQCAQAAEVFRLRCSMEEEPTDAAYVLGKSIASGGADPVVSPVDPSKHVTVDVAARLAAAVARPAAFSRTCFTAPSFSVLGQTYTVPVALFCDFLAACGYMLVAGSGIAGLRIFAS